MQKARFWFGTTLVVIPLMVCAFLFTPGFRLTRSGPVEGWVSYNGRPLAGGSILFVPEDSKEREWALAWIDEKGHYVIGSGWSREGSSSKTRFRICVVPDTHKVRAKAPQGPRARAWGDVEAAWWGVGDVAFPIPTGSSGFPQRLSNPRTTQLEVELGSEPARIDVSL
jgi:hypothetical protein